MQNHTGFGDRLGTIAFASLWLIALATLAPGQSLATRWDPAWVHQAPLRYRVVENRQKASAVLAGQQLAATPGIAVIVAVDYIGVPRAADPFAIPVTSSRGF